MNHKYTASNVWTIITDKTHDPSNLEPFLYSESIEKDIVYGTVMYLEAMEWLYTILQG